MHSFTFQSQSQPQISKFREITKPLIQLNLNYQLNPYIALSKNQTIKTENPKKIFFLGFSLSENLLERESFSLEWISSYLSEIGPESTPVPGPFSPGWNYSRLGENTSLPKWNMSRLGETWTPEHISDFQGNSHKPECLAWASYAQNRNFTNESKNSYNLRATMYVSVSDD